MPQRRLLKRILMVVCLAIPASATVIFACNSMVEHNAAGKLHDNTINIPTQRVGLLLGTAKFITEGNTNLLVVSQFEITCLTE